MKSSIHPNNYRLVVFEDEAAHFSFLTRSTAPTSETIKWKDGKEYPVVKIHISSAEGRVDRFTAKLKAAKAHRQELAKKLDTKAKQAKADAKAKSIKEPVAEAQ